MKLPIEERIEKMRRGEKIPCTRCNGGNFGAIGDPKTTSSFGCDKCHIAMVLTVPMKYD